MNEILFLFIGFAIGAFAIWFYASSTIKSAYDKVLMNERELRVKAESDLRATKEMQAETSKQLKDTFEALASKSLQNNNTSFIQLAQQTMDKYISKASDDYEKRKESIDNVVKPLKESLDKHEVMVKELQNSSSQTFGNLQNYLLELGKSQKSLEKETNALVTALKSPKVRGRWGEIGLKRIVEFSGMSSFCDFQEQVHLSTEDGALRPDMVVNLPDKKKIVVDSKVPLNAYLEAIETDNEEQRKILFANHAKAVVSHMKMLGSKAYWSQFDNSVDFVVLYIEVEPAFGAALYENTNLIIEGMKNRIVFATPTTLITLLQTVSYTWKQHNATENAIQIWQSSKEIYERLATFTEYLQKIGGDINGIVKTYNQAIGSWESRVIPGIKKIEGLGISSEKKSMQQMLPIDNVTRELKEL